MKPQTFRVIITQEFEVTLNESFDLTYEDNAGVRQSRGTAITIAKDLASRSHGYALSKLDGYADLPNDAANVTVLDTDIEAFDMELN